MGSVESAGTRVIECWVELGLAVLASPEDFLGAFDATNGGFCGMKRFGRLDRSGEMEMEKRRFEQAHSSSGEGWNCG